MESSKPGLIALRDERERVISCLSEAFANDQLELDEFERRLTLAHRAEAPAALEALVTDLRPTVGAVAARRPHVVATPLTPIDAEQRVVAVMGAATRRGPWTPPRRLRVLAVMGGVQLDFRDAQLGPGVTEVLVTAVMGGVDMIVPPTLAVDISGVAIMGGFEHSQRAPATPDPERPLLRVRGMTLMGHVGLRTLLPGERDEDEIHEELHRTRRLERHQRRLEKHQRRLENHRRRMLAAGVIKPDEPRLR